jgi:release factor glutamine methyltransferase
MFLKNLRDSLDEASARLGGSPTARRDAELLLMRAADRDRAWLLTHPEAELTPEQSAQFESRIARRAQHEPIQYILGETEFYGLMLKVSPDVLIPRPETEHLVEVALERLPNKSTVRMCDVGTGSGCIAVTLAYELRQAHVTALDLSPAALALAKQNAEQYRVSNRIRFLASDLLSSVQGETFDVIVSNPPYVPDDEPLEAQVRDYEPHPALFAGPTGLEIYRRLIPQAHVALTPGGWLLMEIGHGQQAALVELLSDWDNLKFKDDLQGIPRVAIAQRRA